MKKLDRERAYQNIWAMHCLLLSLSDEDKMMFWLQEAVPDDCRSLQEVKDLFSDYDDDELGSEYERFARIFAKTVRSATADGFSLWSYVGQNVAPTT